jgi:conjugative relaxase-like TrwC/TraI family protein
MLRISPAITATQATHYYRSEFARGDYYTEDNTIVASKWAGAGADFLGLCGAVRPDEFAHVLAGHDSLGRTLVPARAGKAERRAAWDITISPHKSVSLVALVHGDQRVLDAHDRAVEVALAELERHAQAWAGGGRETVTTGSSVIATFRHETSRAVDPQLHTHCVVMNMTRRGSEWRALRKPLLTAGGRTGGPVSGCSELACMSMHFL